MAVLPVSASPLETLGSPSATLSQVMQALKAVDTELGDARVVKLGISAAITADPMGLFMRKHAALHGVKLSIVQGGFDDPLGDIERFAAQGVEQVILLPFLDSLLPHLEARAALLTPEEWQAKLSEFAARYDLALQKASGFDMVYVCSFHRISRAAGSEDAVDRLLDQLNGLLRELAQTHRNVRWINTAGIVQEIGYDAAFDMRFYFRAKAPYSTRFFDGLAKAVSTASRGFGSYFYKCLVLDCDNTLWGGILGEDGVEGVKLDPFDYPGNVYWRVQQQVAQLQSQGVLLCLCSKNNAADVTEMFAKHPGMVLRPEHIVISKVNWQDKPQNLREIASELNLGLGSLIFIDDSDFECNAVRSQLPQVRVLQVPANLPNYPGVLAQAAHWFVGAGVSKESQDKTEQYRLRAAALALQSQFDSQAEYLKSLNLQVKLTRNATESIARISELSQKSNQFNLTTRRYSEAKISAFMQSADSDVFALIVKDRFGDSGLTGVAVVMYEGAHARIDNFFMSCRVIGRGVELAIWPCVAREAIRHGCTQLVAQFIPSAKNALVAGFYDQLGVVRGAAEGDSLTYTFDLKSQTFPSQDHIGLIYAG